KSGVLDEKSKNILQLIAKTIGPARLIEGASGRDPAPASLVGQPVIDEIVETLVGRCNLQLPGRAAPILPAGVQSILEAGISDGSGKLQRIFAGRGITQGEDDSSFLIRLEHDITGKRGTWVTTKAGHAAERSPRPDRSRRGDRTEPSDEVAPAGRK